MDFRKKARIFLYGCLLVLFIQFGLVGCGGSRPTQAGDVSAAARQTAAALMTQTAVSALTQAPTPQPAAQGSTGAGSQGTPQVEKSGGITQEPARNVMIETPSSKTTMEAYHAPTIEPTKGK